MRSGVQSVTGSPQSRSGVHLEYTPEDTLKSFVMEKRIQPGSSTTQANKANDNNGNTKCSKTLSSEINPLMVKRPFLRKNQGRAAWCSRLRSPTRKVIDISEKSSKSSLSANNNQNKSPEHFRPLKSKTLLKKMENIPQLLSSTGDDSTSTICPPLSTFSSNNGEIIVKNGNGCLNTTGDEKELAEFELLERLAENQHSNIVQQNILDEHQLTRNPARQTKTADAPLDNEHQANNSGNLQGVSDQSTGKIYLDYGHENLSTLVRLHPDKPNPSTIEPASLEFDDQEPWDDETDIESSASTKETSPCRHQSFPSVRFNVPGDVTDSNFENKNRNVIPPNPAKKSSEKALSSVKVWIARLEAEVNRFNTETAVLMKLRKEKEEALSALDKEKKEFTKYKETAMREFETFRQDEICKLKKERKVLSDYQRSLHSMPPKRDREEIERLKQQISDEKAEAAQRETRLQHQLNRQRLRIDELTTEKNELLDRIKRLERARLSMQNATAEERSNRLLNGCNMRNREFKSQSQADCLAQSTLSSQYNGSSSNLPDIEEELKSTRISSTASTSNRSVVEQCQLSISRSMNGDLTIKESPPDPLAVHLPSRSPSETTSCRNEIDTSTAQTSHSSKVLSEGKHGSVLREGRQPDGSFKRLHCDGSQTMDYANGSAKEIFSDGVSPKICLLSGDSKQKMEAGTFVYEYGTVQTATPTGIEVVYNDGRREVNHFREQIPLSHPPTSLRIPPSFSNSPYRKSLDLSNHIMRPVVVEESHFPDGMSVKIFSNGDKVISLPNGQRELHCSEFKRRIYPDGTVKTVFSDGHQETHYASGRVRIKDSEGNLLMDTRIAPVSQNAATGLAAFFPSTSHLPTPR